MHERIWHVDFALLQWIQQYLTNPFMDTIMPIITTCGTHGHLWLAAVIILLIPQKTRRYGITLLITMGLIWLICEFGVKPIIARPRPFMLDESIQLLINPPSGYSFPSGHTLTAFCAATILTFAPLQKGYKIAGWVMATLIAFSRLYLFVHFPSDVLAGVAIGVSSGLLGIWVSDRLSAWRQSQQETDDSPKDKVSVE